MYVSSFQVDDLKTNPQITNISHRSNMQSDHSDYEEIKMQLNEIQHSLQTYQRKFQSNQSTKFATSQQQTDQQQQIKLYATPEKFTLPIEKFTSTLEKLTPPPSYSRRQSEPFFEAKLPILQREYIHPKTLAQEFGLRKLKYFDTFTPSNQKIMNSPFRLLKHNILHRDQTMLRSLLDDFNTLIQ